MTWTVLDKSFQKDLSKAVVVRDPVSGRKLELWTNQLGLLFYTNGQLNATNGKDAAIYHKCAGIALVTQGFPDSVNYPYFPSQIVKLAEICEHNMVYRFTAS